MSAAAKKTKKTSSKGKEENIDAKQSELDAQLMLQRHSEVLKNRLGI